MFNTPHKQSWNRRKFVQYAACLTATAFTGKVEAQYLPVPEPLIDNEVTFVASTLTSPWRQGHVYKPGFTWDMLNLNVEEESLSQATHSQATMQGFGACFNELGWIALQKLSSDTREQVMHELFSPTEGARLSYCRMPIGANDFSRNAYSYDEVDGDFTLKHFSIEHDRETLIPFIHAAQAFNPSLRIWASPWTPPSWMKRNHFYAEAEARGDWKPNGIRPDQVGHEGEDMFLLDAAHLRAYADYFLRFVEAYAAEGIRIGMVMPQNEFNSAQNFPSCTWTPQGLTQFLRLLGPEMQRRHVEVFFGTLERGNAALFEAVKADDVAGRYLKGIGVQWAGKNALPDLHRKFPELPIYGSEQECGDGSNSWDYTGYCWDLMKTYFRNGARGYMYWNIALQAEEKSTWGWSQNSLVVVDPVHRTFRYTPDFYLLKHLTHFVEVGAASLQSTGTCDNTLCFRNADGSTVFLIRNERGHNQSVQVQTPSKTMMLNLPPDSISTVRIGPPRA